MIVKENKMQDTGNNVLATVLVLIGIIILFPATLLLEFLADRKRKDEKKKF